MLAIGGAGDSNFAITSSGEVLSWGANTMGVLGNGFTGFAISPVLCQVSQSPDFEIAAEAQGLTLTPQTVGATATTAVTVMPQSRFAGAVSFSASDVPAGLAVSFEPVSTAASPRETSTTVTVTATSALPRGVMTVTLTGTAAGAPGNTHSVSLRLEVGRPAIDTMTPNTGTPGTAVTIAGSGFGAAQGSVFFVSSGQWASAIPALVTSWSDVAITATVPVTPPGRSSVVVATSAGVTSNHLALSSGAKVTLGAACTSNVQCTPGWCDPNLPGGHCTADCITDADCGAIGACVDEMCFLRCTGNAGCRSGYVCDTGVCMAQ